METKPKFTINRTTKILSPANSYDFSQDSRLLIPFTAGDKIGFINQDKDVVVKPQFDMYYGECYAIEDLIKVSKIESYGFPRQGGNVSCYQRPLYGIINYKGEILIDIEFFSIISAISNKTLFTVQNKKYQYGVINIYGEEIVPFGKYDWIDGFDNGVARVKKGKMSNGYINNDNKWGLINEEGEEILQVEYDDIWSFYGKNRKSTKIIKNGCAKDIFFKTINSKTKNKHQNYYSDDYEENYYNHTYDEYAGSYAQDIMGYSDDIINDAFEGDPDAYWNID
jgi:hypothetical protein